MVFQRAHLNQEPHGPQPTIPKPSRAEATPEAAETLAAALDSIGDMKKATAVRDHTENFWLDECPKDGKFIVPDSDGHALCPWCRWRKLGRWCSSLCEAGGYGEGQVFEVLVSDFDPPAFRKAVSKVVLADRVAAVYDARPAESARWRFTLIVAGGSEAGVERLLARLRDIPGGTGMVSTRVIRAGDLGATLDRSMTRLSDFVGKPAGLRQYIEADWGQQVIRPRPKKTQASPDIEALAGPTLAREPTDDEVEPASRPLNFPEPEDAFDIFVAKQEGRGVEAEGGASELTTARPEGPRLPPTAVFGVEIGTPPNDPSRGLESIPEPGAADTGAVMQTPPPGLVPVSILPEDAVTPGRRCPICRGPTKRLGMYKLRNGRLRRLSGDGPEEIGRRSVFDPGRRLQEVFDVPAN